jgi:6-phosphogluconolactonase
MRIILLLVATLSLVPFLGTALDTSQWILYVGTFTQQGSKGIYAYRFDGRSGHLSPVGLVAETSNPSFLAIHPNQKFLYAVNEDSNGMVSAFGIDQKTAKLSPLNSVSAHGSSPCHLAMDSTGRWLFVANYNSGSVAALPVGADGRLGEASTVVHNSGSSINPQRQAGPHAHSVNVSGDNRFLFVSDLGLDKVLVARFDALKGTLIPNDPPFVKITPGSGPRHLAFSQPEGFAYVLSEMSSTVTTLRYDKRGGSFEEIQTLSALPAGYSGSSSGAEIAVHQSGKFVYSSNRGHDSISVFAVDASTGKLRLVANVPTRGKTPRNFAIDPSGSFLLAANQNTNNVVVFRINQRSGELTFAGSVDDIPSPVSLVFAAIR